MKAVGPFRGIVLNVTECSQPWFCLENVKILQSYLIKTKSQHDRTRHMKILVVWSQVPRQVITDHGKTNRLFNVILYYFN